MQWDDWTTDVGPTFPIVQGALPNAILTRDIRAALHPGGAATPTTIAIVQGA